MCVHFPNDEGFNCIGCRVFGLDQYPKHLFNKCQICEADKVMAETMRQHNKSGLDETNSAIVYNMECAHCVENMPIINKLRSALNKCKEDQKSKNVDAQQKVGRVPIPYKFVEGSDKKPHKCPVCDGEGYKPRKSMDQANRESCNACNKTGIVWG